MSTPGGRGRAAGLVVLIAAASLGAADARADEARGADARASDARAATWHVGVDLRTDLRAHPLRLGGGMRLGALDVGLVLDPMALLDGEHDGDLVVAWPADRPWWGFAGVRVSTIALRGGAQWQHKTLVGLGATLPPLGALHGRVGLELAVLWVKHGGELPTAWIGLDRGVGDLVQLGLWLRLEVAGGP